MIKVNDIVTLSGENLGNAYSSYSKWFDAFNLFDVYDYSLYGRILEFHFNDHPDDTYTCIWIAPHLTNPEKTLYAIQSQTTKRIFLVGEDVIGNNTHSYSSYNPCKDALKVICNNYNKIIDDNIHLKDMCNKFTVKLKQQSNPMPALKNGMYGVIEIEDFNEGIDTDTFIVYGGKIVTLGGRVFDATNFNDSYYHEDFHYMYRITTIYDGGAPIDNVADFSKQIWKYND